MGIFGGAKVDILGLPGVLKEPGALEVLGTEKGKSTRCVGRTEYRDRVPHLHHVLKFGGLLLIC